jgi:hypothetical protein
MPSLREEKNSYADKQKTLPLFRCAAAFFVLGLQFNVDRTAP